MLNKTYIAIIMVIFLATGCVGTKFVDKRVNIIDPFLTPGISITEVTTAVNNGGFMEVQVTGINNKSSYKKLEYKINWIDQNGFIIQSTMSRWTTFPAYENSEFKFKAVAPKMNAIDFSIKLRGGE